MLCFRCEHRAKFLDDSLAKKKHCHRPRHECGEIETSKCACYMFKPCLPIVTEPASKRDIRPRFASPMLSSKEHVVRLLEDVKLDIIYQNGDEVALGWRSK